MSAEHKAALARGRTEARAINRYLTALANRRPGRPVTPETLQAKLTRIEGMLTTESDPLKRLELLQQRIDASDAIEHLASSEVFDQLEAGFINNAPAYSQRKGISYSAWRDAGVPAATLRKAGLSRRA
jgi:hypothetical protein